MGTLCAQPTTRTHTHNTQPIHMARLITFIAFAASAAAFTPTLGRSRFHRSNIDSRMVSMKELMTPAKLEQAFTRFDVDGSGQVDLDEFMEKMRALDMPFNDMELEQMFNEMDASSNGGVDSEEFKAYVVNNAYVGVVRRLAAAPSKIREVYESFKGTSDVLELEAFQTGMISLGMPYNKIELEEMFGEIDITNNGGVDYEEFSEFLSQKVVPQWAQALTR